ncbi:super-infection exclusion protein B [Elizabethkingia anophelis]|nr:superinfection exclusion B family protein [Elizabethkingia anophelis]ELB1894310.1 superinfection exclusion B family protein [Elizabethkingia anophelis]
MPIDFKSIFDFTKAPTRFFAAIALFSGVILISGPKLIKFLRIEKQFAEYGYIIGGLFLLSSCIVLISFLIYIYNKIVDRIYYNKYRKSIIYNIKNLDITEIMVLRLFHIVKTNTLELGIKNHVISALLEKRILKINSPYGESFFVSGFDYKTSVSITDEAKKNLKYIKQHMHPPTKEELETLKNLGIYV